MNQVPCCTPSLPPFIPCREGQGGPLSRPWPSWLTHGLLLPIICPRLRLFICRTKRNYPLPPMSTPPHPSPHPPVPLSQPYPYPTFIIGTTGTTQHVLPSSCLRVAPRSCDLADVALIMHNSDPVPASSSFMKSPNHRMSFVTITSYIVTARIAQHGSEVPPAAVQGHQRGRQDRTANSVQG